MSLPQLGRLEVGSIDHLEDSLLHMCLAPELGLYEGWAQLGLMTGGPQVAFPCDLGFSSTEAEFQEEASQNSVQRASVTRTPGGSCVALPDLAHKSHDIISATFYWLSRNH